MPKCQFGHDNHFESLRQEDVVMPLHYCEWLALACGKLYLTSSKCRAPYVILFLFCFEIIWQANQVLHCGECIHIHSFWLKSHLIYVRVYFPFYRWGLEQNKFLFLLWNEEESLAVSVQKTDGEKTALCCEDSNVSDNLKMNILFIICCCLILCVSTCFKLVSVY